MTKYDFLEHEFKLRSNMEKKIKNKFFGEELKRIRKSKKMTINELSEKSSVSSSYISQIENGKRDTPTPELIKKLAHGLSIDYYHLMRIAGYLNPDEDNFITLEQLIKEVPNEEKINDMIEHKKKIGNKSEKKVNSTEDSKFYRFLNERPEINYDGLNQEELDNHFKSFLEFNAHAGHYLKYLRIFNAISQKEMANLLQIKEETYTSLETTLREDSPYLVKHSEDIGKILNVSNFLDWYKFIRRQKELGYNNYGTKRKESIYTEISLNVKKVEKKINKSGHEYYVEYSDEELKRRLFDLDHLLNQKEHEVLYKDRVLTEEDIEKIKTMLNVIFD
ncbi:helix-turn-helix transcriptional regulator [Bacillus aquiflavi]|uniref:Helix-turn-helix transcriptional regulator n=1 Tax=Bacillus aquiflavi TaxID=2672567 RepID=A0A6B3W4M8_9BACI|nr:helix-turn-helix transcriptional regulator [Bacillus aquiflavi]MBA4538581.1 helix-turn-helix transcriptional regulator [Bacillus aquiflavi]NEY82943.1 helix-turn-helix transcriptional regulator [Bacillus aquiflavi]